MDEDDLSRLLDDAAPRCPSCGEQLQDSGPVYRPHMYCPNGCRVAVIVRPDV